MQLTLVGKQVHDFARLRMTNPEAMETGPA
jgi:hypothetical protein